MKKLFHLEIFVVFAAALGITVTIFHQYFFAHKTVFPSNLLVTAYAPWTYEPVPEYPNGPPNKPMGFDDIRQSYPDRQLLRDSLLKGIIPLWNPYIYSGAPFMAASDKTVWYPLSWIATILPTIEGWNLLVMIQPFLSLVFMYVFLKSLRFRIPIAAFGSFVYALSGWMVVYWQEPSIVEHSFLWLPLALYASNRLWKYSDDILGFCLLLFSLVCSVFGGFLQMSIYVYAVVLTWNVFQYFQYREQRNVYRVACIIFVALLCSVLIECIQLIPSIQAFVLSPRGTNSASFVFRDDLLPIQQLMTLIAPDYWGNPATYNYFGGSGFYFEKIIFIGIMPLIFAMYAMFQTKQKTILFWTVLGLVCFSMGYALPTSWFPYYLHIPILSNSYPTRIFAVSVFSFSILSCYGLESFIERPNRKRIACILIGLFILLGIGWATVMSAWCIINNVPTHIVPLCFGNEQMIWSRIRNIFPSKEITELYITVSLRNLIVPTLLLLSGIGVVLVSRISKKFLFFSVCILTAISSFYFIEKYVYFGENRFVYPNLPVISKLTALAGYDRVWGYGNAFIETNFPEYFHWFSTDGYSNLSSSRYAELIATIDSNGKLGGAFRRSDTDLFQLSETDPFEASNPYRLRLMSLFGVKYVLETKKGELKDKQPTGKRFPSELFTLTWEDANWRIWQYMPAIPRTLFATNYIVKTKPQEIITALYDNNINLSTTVLLEKNPGSMTLPSNNQSHATILFYDINSVTIRTTSTVAGFLLLTDTYYPGWTATVDGKSVEIYRADYALRAVSVPSGDHTVIFRYTPVIFTVGIIVTCIGLFVSVAVFIYLYRGNQKKKNNSN